MAKKPNASAGNVEENKAIPTPVPAIEDLQNEIVTYKTEIETLKSEIAEFKKVPAAIDNAKLVAEIADLKQQLFDASTLNDELMNQVETKTQEISTGYPIAEHEGDRYQILTPKIRHNNEVLTAEQLKQRPDVLMQLIASNSGAIVKTNY